MGEDQHRELPPLLLQGRGRRLSTGGCAGQAVAELLERYHFKVDVKEDALFARLEGEPMDYMLGRLRILGYMTIHTRQLDMIMMNEAQVANYRNKIIADLENIVLPPEPAKTEPQPDTQA